MSGKAYYNGVIYTADAELPVAEAFAIENGKFIFVGKTSDLPECEERIDLEGKCVIPGLIDSHCHMIAGITQSAANMLFIDPKTAPDHLAEEISTQLRHHHIPETETITIMGIDLTIGEFSAANIDLPFRTDRSSFSAMTVMHFCSIQRLWKSSVSARRLPIPTAIAITSEMRTVSRLVLLSR